MAIKRLVISIKDVAKIYGKSYVQAFRIHMGIRKALGKGENQVLTFLEFSQHTGISIAEIENFIQ